MYYSFNNPYPFDYNLGDRFVRPKSGIDYWGYRGNEGSFVKLGHYSPELRAFDELGFSGYFARSPYAQPNGTQFLFAPPITLPALKKGTP